MKIGIDLGGSHIAIGVVNSENKIIEKKEKHLTNEEKRNIKENIEKYIIESINELKTKNSIESIGMSVPGTICENKILKSVNLGIKEEYNLQEKIEQKLNIPTKIKNDAKCAALAENKIGCLKGINRTLFITLGTGIGGAIIINGKLLDTGKYPGIEIGHMIVEKKGKKCKCGKQGCLEQYASMKALKNNLRKELGLTQKTRGEELLRIIRNNKEENENYQKIESTIEEFIEYLAIGISNLINIFEPEAIGIGGSFVYFEDVLLERLRKKIVTDKLLFNNREDLKIFSAVLGNDAGIIGATLE